MEIKAREIEIIPVSELIPHPKNMHKHSDEQIERLCKLIEYQGFRSPVIVQKGTNLIVAGHGRILAAKKLGIKEVPVLCQEFESEAQLYAFMVSDNAIGKDTWATLDLGKINSDMIDLGPDFDIEMLGLKDFILEPVEKFEPQTNEDEIPEVVDPITRRGDIWLLGNHRLMCGDSTMIDDVEKLMNGEKADLWIADPPFGVSYMEKNAAVHGGVVKNQTGKEIKSDTKTVDELKPFWLDVSSNAFLVTSNEASNYWCACQGSDKMMMMMMMMMDEAGWNIRHELIWVKQNFVFGRCDYHYRHEPIIFGWKKKGKHNWYGDRKSDSVFEIDRPFKSDLHPTTKPVELFRRFILNSTKQNDLVLESFGGSGTSIVAATEAGRRCNTMELDEKYCDVIINRWQNFTGKKAVLELTNQTYEELKSERETK